MQTWRFWGFVPPFVALCLTLATGLRAGAQEGWVGVWQTGAYDTHQISYLDLGQFTKEWKKWLGKGLHLVDVDTFLENGERKWSGVFRGCASKKGKVRCGSDNEFIAGLDWKTLFKKSEGFARRGLRLARIKTYFEGGERKWAAIWRGGDLGWYAFAGLNLAQLTAKVRQMMKKGMRVVDLDTYIDASERLYAGVWRASNDDQQVLVGKTWPEFEKAFGKFHKEGLRLTAIQTYRDGPTRLWAGVWRGRRERSGEYLWMAADRGKFQVKWFEMTLKNHARLVAMRTFEDPPRRFYAIAHMVNTTAAVDWAISHGMNGLEVDITFATNGEPLKIRHGAPCDCTCNPIPSSAHICGHLGPGDPIKRCGKQTPLAVMLNHMASKRSAALVLFDSKVVSPLLSATAQAHAGRRVIELANQHLFGKGYRGKLIVGASHRDGFPYLKAAVKEANRSKYAGRIYFSLDQENNVSKSAPDTIGLLASLPTRNRAYGAGVSACGAGNYHDEMQSAVRNIGNGSLALAYTWSYDAKGSMEKYLDDGVSGIFTNKPKYLMELVRERGLILASPSDPLPEVTTNGVAP